MPFDGRNYGSRLPVRKALHASGQVMSGALWGHNLRNAYAYSRRHSQGGPYFCWPRPIQLATYFDDPDTLVTAAMGLERVFLWRRYVELQFTHAVAHFIFSVQVEDVAAELRLTAGSDASPTMDTVDITVPVGASSPFRSEEPIADPFLQGGRYEALVELPLVNARGPAARFFQLWAKGVLLRPDAVSTWFESRG